MDEGLASLAKDWLTKAWHDLLTARIVAEAEITASKPRKNP